MDLASVLALGNQTMDKSAASAEALQLAMGAQLGAQGKQIQAVKAGAEAKEVIETQRAAGALQAQEGSRAFATTAGTNMASSTEIMSLLGSQMRSAALDLAAKQDKVNKIASKSTLGNPLGLLYDAFYGDEARAELEGSKAHFDNASKTLQALNSASQTVAQTQTAIAEMETEGTVLARAKLVQAEAAQAIASIQERQASTNASLVSALNQMDRAQLSTAVQMYNLVAMDEERQFNREMRESARREKMEQAEADAEWLASVNAALSFRGQQPAGSTQVLLRRFSRAELDDLDRQGISILAGRPRFGEDPGGALATLQANPGMRVPDIQQPVVDWMRANADTLSPDAMKNAGMVNTLGEANLMITEARKKPEKMRELVGSYLTAMARREASELSLSRTDGVYSLPPVDILGTPDHAKLFEGNPFLQAIQPVIAAGGNGQFNPERLLTAEMLSKFKSDDIAEGMHAISAALYANGPIQRNLTRAFGIPDLREYTTVVTGSTGAPTSPYLFAGPSSKYSKQINILDKSEWNVFLAELKARQAGRSILSQARDRLVNLNNVDYSPRDISGE